MADLYRCYLIDILRYVRARVPDEDTAQDVTAEVFLEALRSLPRYEPTDVPFFVWLFRIARTETADYWRQQRRYENVRLTERLPAADSVLDDHLEFEADWRTAVDLLAELTDDQRNVLVMRSFGGMSLSATAAALGKSVGAVKALERRARAALARLREC